jgi:hypothetical protein
MSVGIRIGIEVENSLQNQIVGAKNFFVHGGAINVEVFNKAHSEF